AFGRVRSVQGLTGTRRAIGGRVSGLEKQVPKEHKDRHGNKPEGAPREAVSPCNLLPKILHFPLRQQALVAPHRLRPPFLHRRPRGAVSLAIALRLFSILP